MNKQGLLLLLLMLGAILLLPTPGSASFLIQLKNGSAILVNHYWEEEGQVKFYRYGGIVGVPKAAVKGITKSTKRYVEGGGAAYIPEKKPTAPPTTETEPGPDEKQAGAEPPPSEPPPAKDPEIVRTMAELRNRAQSLAVMDASQVTKLRDALYGLKKEITSDSEKISAHEEELDEIKVLLREVKRKINEPASN